MTPGFANPVLDAQACFRCVLDAMARPGTMHAVQGPADTGLDPATAAVLLTLCDADTSVCSQIGDKATTIPWLQFHCGAPIHSADQAEFIVTDQLEWSSYGIGSDDAPERSATVILQVAALGSGATLTLSGPGIAEATSLAVAGLPDDFAAQWARNRARFPRGFDVILCAGDRMAVLPRSVTVA